jgi:hypothetical protein
MEGTFMKQRIEWKEIARTALVVGLLAVGLVACSSDDSDDDPPAAGTGAGVAAGGMGGASGGAGGASGGAGGRSGAGGAGGAGGAPMTIMCNGMPCMGFTSAAGTMLMPCCDAMEGMACGAITDTMGTCIARMSPGTADASCPTAQSLLNMPVPGCCKPDGKCGLMSGTLMGCVERTRYPTTFLMTVMGMAPPPLTAAMCGDGADGGI